MNQELVRIVENIARDKNIDKESIFNDLEDAMVSAVRKRFSDIESEVEVSIDRVTGEIETIRDGEQIDIRTLGRIPAQVAKQVMIQKIRADELDSIYAEYIKRKGEIVSGAVARHEGGSLVITLSHRSEAYLPKTEQIMGQSHRPGERIRALILDVKEIGSKVKIILSRTHPDFIRRLFESEVPEIAEEIIEICVLAREAGYRTKVAVTTHDDKVDPVGACVGVRGSRIKNIVDELGGEKIDIIRWNESSQVLITNSLMPAKVSEIALCFELARATVVVTEDQLSLAIGKHGQNVRLAAKLTGWDIDILTPSEYNTGIERLTECVKTVEGAEEALVDKLIALGIITVLDLEDVGAGPLVEELAISADVAANLVKVAGEIAKDLSAQSKKKAEDAAEKKTEEATEQKDEDVIEQKLEDTTEEQAEEVTEQEDETKE